MAREGLQSQTRRPDSLNHQQRVALSLDTEEDDQGLEQIREGKEWKGGGRNGVKERLAWGHLLWAAKWLCTEKLFQVGEFAPFPV